MIAALEGILEHHGTDSIILNVGGIGFQVFVPSSTLSHLGVIHDRVLLFTHLQLKEDNISLYGFASSEELTLFKNFISVSGVGPKMALSLLSALNAEQLVMAITSGDATLISQVPGIGKKVASRLVTELSSKLTKEWKGITSPLDPESADIIAALTNLGYSLKEATNAIYNIPNPGALSLEEKFKIALHQITRE